jgi:hypothetical protein
MDVRLERRTFLGVIAAAAVAIALVWWLMIRMPEKNVVTAAPLSPDEIALREELRADVQKLAGEIGERNMWHYPQLNAAADLSRIPFCVPAFVHGEILTKYAAKPATISRRRSLA